MDYVVHNTNNHLYGKKSNQNKNNIILKLYPDKELYSDMYQDYFNCISETREECPCFPRLSGVPCSIQTRNKVIQLLLNNIQGIINYV